jgi:hypothetical protein
MDWQQILSLIVVAATAVLLVRNEMRKRHRANQGICGRDCGCSSSETLEKFKKEHKEVFS